MFYRVEHPKSGLGPFFELNRYSSKIGINTFNELCWRHYNFPTPINEGLSRELNNCTWYCGYRTKELMLEYVQIDLLTTLIKEFYFKVYRIEARSTQVGVFQVIFTKESIISKVDITSEFIN